MLAQAARRFVPQGSCLFPCIAAADRRRDRLPPDRRIQRVEIARQRLERRIGNRADDPQRVVGPHPFVQIDVAEHAAAVRVVAAHRHPPFPHPKESAMPQIRNPFCSSLLERVMSDQPSGEGRSRRSFRAAGQSAVGRHPRRSPSRASMVAILAGRTIDGAGGPAAPGSEITTAPTQPRCAALVIASRKDPFCGLPAVTRAGRSRRTGRSV
jgi:hypothetical protein